MPKKLSEYCFFIKQVILYKLYIEYNKILYNTHRQTNKPLKEVFETHTSEPNKSMWDALFNIMYIPIQYFHALCKDSIVKNAYTNHSQSTTHTNIYTFIYTVDSNQYEEMLYDHLTLDAYMRQEHKYCNEMNMITNNMQGINISNQPRTQNHNINSVNPLYVIINPTEEDKAKYMKNEEIKVLKNIFVREIINLVKMHELHNIPQTDSDVYINFIPYFEYIANRTTNQPFLPQNIDAPKVLYDEYNNSSLRFFLLERYMFDIIEKVIG